MYKISQVAKREIATNKTLVALFAPLSFPTVPNGFGETERACMRACIPSRWTHEVPKVASPPRGPRTSRVPTHDQRADRRIAGTRRSASDHTPRAMKKISIFR